MNGHTTDLDDDVRGCSCGHGDFGAPGHDGGPAYTPTNDSPAAGASAPFDDDGGLIETRVDGIDAHIYAHHSTTVPDALLVGVDAAEGQRILFVVNDGDVLDTTVGEPIVTAVDAGRPAGPPPAAHRRDMSVYQREYGIDAGRALCFIEAADNSGRDLRAVARDAIAHVLLYLADQEGADAADAAAAAMTGMGPLPGDWTGRAHSR